MSFLGDIKNSVVTYNLATNGQVNIFGGKGNADIEIHTGNADVITKSGNHVVNAEVNNELYIDTGRQGVDEVYGYARNAQIQTYEDDDIIALNCESLDLDVGCGNDNIVVSASNRLSINGNCGSKAIIAESLGSNQNNFITLGNGNHTIETVGNNFGISVGNGNLTLGTIGNSYRIIAGDGNHKIGFYGNDVKIDVGNGTTHDIRTLDNWIGAKEFTNTHNLVDFGFFNRNISLANTLESVSKIYTDETNGQEYIGISGVKDVEIKTGLGTLQGLLTINSGSLSVTVGGKLNTSMDLGENGTIQDFQVGLLRAQGGYLVKNE